MEKRRLKTKSSRTKPGKKKCRQRGEGQGQDKGREVCRNGRKGL